MQFRAITFIDQEKSAVATRDCAKSLKRRKKNNIGVVERWRRTSPGGPVSITRCASGYNGGAHLGMGVTVRDDDRFSQALRTRPMKTWIKWAPMPVAMISGGAVYYRLYALSVGCICNSPQFAQASPLERAVTFFAYKTPMALLLLAFVVFAMGIVRSFFTPERTRRWLMGRHRALGHVTAAGLGVVTPFCSCSAVPLFIGFVTAGIPLGMTLSFLIAAPMVNEVALVLLYGLFGARVAFFYLVTGFSIAVLAGWVIGRLGMERHVDGWVYRIPAAQKQATETPPTWEERLLFGLQAVRDIVGKVWLYLIAGIGVGAIIHGYMPQDLLAGILGKHAWWSVPAAVAVGVPIYSSPAGVIPVMQALLEKGAALGTVLAFMMSVIGLSLPEIMILRKVLKPRLIAVFIAVVGGGILTVGYLFNLVL
jgi:hypothetical protein